MKQKQIGAIMILATVLFIVFIAGFILGRRNNIATQYIATEASTTVLETESTASNSLKIDINTASVEQLIILDGIGEILAQRIIDYRTEHGPFEQITDITNVSGIGAKKFEQISDYITIGG